MILIRSGVNAMKSVFLPISNPLSRGYLHNAYQLAILGTKDETKTWIFMNYIQLISEIGNHRFPITFYMPDHMGYNWSILSPWFEYSVITRDHVKQLKIDFKELIKSSLFNNQYVYLYVNEKYIPGTLSESLDQNFNHQILLYGYDESTGEVAFLGYDKNRQFTKRTVNIEHLELSYFNNTYDFEMFENRIYLLKLRKDPGFLLELDLNSIIDQLINLRDSKRVVNNVIDYHRDYSYKYGLDTYDNFMVNLKLFKEKNIQGERDKLITPMHIAMEHKMMMIERLKYISALFPNINVDESIKDFSLLKQKFETLRNLMIKYELIQDSHILEHAMNELIGLKENEKKVLTRLIDTLRESIVQ